MIVWVSCAGDYKIFVEVLVSENSVHHVLVDKKSTEITSYTEKQMEEKNTTCESSLVCCYLLLLTYK
jgi:hypothetical protein